MFLFLSLELLGKLRFQRKVPSSSSDLSWADIIVALFRLRKPESIDVDHDRNLDALLRRIVHTFAQAVELGFEKDGCLTSNCPDPTVFEAVHPYLKSSRLQGNSSLKQNLVQRFMARGGGYVSIKNEIQLKDLGVVSKTSTIGTRTSLEFAARSLIKCNQFVTAMVNAHRVINFCFDAATVGEHHVPCLSTAYPMIT